MPEPFTLSLALLVGAALGAMFFAGLWWTVRRGVVSGQPALWFLGSLLVRTGIAVTGFFLVSGGDWRRLIACLLGFAVARSVVMRLTAEQVRHAP